jgi:hypothetical protein
LAVDSYVQARLDFRMPEVALTTEPPGLAVHVLFDGDFVTHVQPDT